MFNWVWLQHNFLNCFECKFQNLKYMKKKFLRSLRRIVFISFIRQSMSDIWDVFACPNYWQNHLHDFDFLTFGEINPWKKNIGWANIIITQVKLQIDVILVSTNAIIFSSKSCMIGELRDSRFLLTNQILHLTSFYSLYFTKQVKLENCF